MKLNRLCVTVFGKRADRFSQFALGFANQGPLKDLVNALKDVPRKGDNPLREGRPASSMRCSVDGSAVVAIETLNSECCRIG